MKQLFNWCLKILFDGTVRVHLQKFSSPQQMKFFAIANLTVPSAQIIQTYPNINMFTVSIPRRSRIPSFDSIMLMQGWLSQQSMNDQLMPSLMYSSCSSLNTCCETKGVKWVNTPWMGHQMDQQIINGAPDGAMSVG